LNAFLLGFFCWAILLGPHLADLLFTDRRWRDGIETSNEQQQKPGGDAHPEDLQREAIALRITAGDQPCVIVRAPLENSDLYHRSEQDD